MSEIIESNPEILNGKPIFKGTRIPINLIFELFGLKYSVDQILDEYPTLSKEKVILALKLGRDAIEEIGKTDLTRVFQEESIET